MTKHHKNAKREYVINGKTFEVLSGSRAQVWHGTAYKTSGGLTKHHIMQNKNGRIVSKAKHDTAKKEKRLVKAGYGTRKGTFGFVKIGEGSKSKKHSKKSRKSRRHRTGKNGKKRGGTQATTSLMPAEF